MVSSHSLRDIRLTNTTNIMSRIPNREHPSQVSHSVTSVVASKNPPSVRGLRISFPSSSSSKAPKRPRSFGDSSGSESQQIGSRSESAASHPPSYTLQVYWPMLEPISVDSSLSFRIHRNVHYIYFPKRLFDMTWQLLWLALLLARRVNGSPYFALLMHIQPCALMHSE